MSFAATRHQATTKSLVSHHTCCMHVARTRTCDAYNVLQTTPSCPHESPDADMDESDGNPEADLDHSDGESEADVSSEESLSRGPHHVIVPRLPRFLYPRSRFDALNLDDLRQVVQEMMEWYEVRDHASDEDPEDIVLCALKGLPAAPRTDGARTRKAFEAILGKHAAACREWILQQQDPILVAMQTMIRVGE